MHSLNPASLYTIYRGQKGNQGLSPRLWGLLVDQALSPDIGTEPKAMGDDFLNLAEVAPAIAGPTAGMSGGYGVFVSTATTTSSVQQIAHQDGVVELTAGGTAHHQASMQAGGNTGASWFLPGTTASDLVLFEARVRIPATFNSAGQGVFVGVAAPGNSAVNFLVNTTMAVKDTNLIGFHFPIGATNVIRPVFRKAGVAVNDSIGVVKTYTPGEWVKLGFAFNRRAQPKDWFTFYVDNKSVGSVGRDQVSSLMPVDVGLSPILCAKALGAAGAKLQCDWLATGKS
jgi:hypothetical protein